MSHCTKTMVQNLVENYFCLGFQTTRWALFGLDSGAVPSFRATVFPCPAGCVFSLGRKRSSSNRSSRMVLCLIVQPVVQKLVENYCFSRVSEGTLTLFGLDSGAVPSFRATVFPCPAGCIFSFGRKSSSSNRSSRRVLCLIVQKQWYKNWSKTIFSRVSDDTLGTFWARFWRCSVLQGHCVSLSGRVRFEPREEEQQQQQEQQEGSMSHFTKSGIKTGRKSQTIVFLGFHKGR